MKKRNMYLNQLIVFRNKPFIKIVTGVRRCGKSSLLDLFEQYLLDNGVIAKSIVRMNFESLEFDEIKDYKALHVYIQKMLNPNEINYILLDEVQLVDQWEKTVNLG